MKRVLCCLMLAILMSTPAFSRLFNGDFEYWSNHPDASDWTYVITIQDDPLVGWYVHDEDDGTNGSWLDDGYAGYEHIVGTNGDHIAVISWSDTGSAISQNLGTTFVEGETYTFSIDIYGEAASADSSGFAGEHWCIGIGTEDMSNQNASQRQRNALALAASNAVVGDRWADGDWSDYTVLEPPDVFSGWQTRSVSYTATAEDVGKEIVVFFSGGFLEVGADRDTCFDNATFVSVPVNLVLARNPYPAHNATEVDSAPILIWTPGIYAPQTNGHKVYFSDVFEEVDQGLEAANQGVYDDPEFPTAGLDLEYSMTYYWRVDEANIPTDGWDNGETWQFTVEPIAYPILGENISAIASSDNENQEPKNTIDGSGLDVNDLHNKEIEDMWLSAGGADEPAWIQYDLDKDYKLYEMWIWNYNAEGLDTIFGLRDVTVEYSTDGINWTEVNDVPEFSQAPGDEDYAHDIIVDLGGVIARHVKITAISNWSSGLFDQYGLSEVSFRYIPVNAREPRPADGAMNVALDTILNWRAGREADEHNVYLSADQQAVIDGTAHVRTLTQTSYSPSTFDLESTYFWRIEEVNNAGIPSIWYGDIWSFTTQEYLVVDDFEDYDDYPPDEIFNTWIDGYGDLTNGSTAGYTAPDFILGEHYLEDDIVHGGNWSMPLLYDNSAARLSEVTVSTDDLAIGRDWTKGGAQILVLWFYGDPDNSTTEQMYIKVNNTPFEYTGDPGNLTRSRWTQWNIDLAPLDLTLSNITTFGIAFESNGDTGGSGTLLIDDIRLYKTPPPEAEPVDPGSDNLVASYSFENNVQDGSGNGLNGTIIGNPVFVEGIAGMGLLFDGVNDYVDFGNNEAFDITEEITLSAWVNTNDSGNAEHNPYVSKGDQTYAIKHSDGNLMQFFIYDGTWLTANVGVDDSFNGEWHHVAGTYDGMELKLYINGGLGATTAYEGSIEIQPHNLTIARNSQEESRFYDGVIDEVKIYNRALSEVEILYLSNL